MGDIFQMQTIDSVRQEDDSFNLLSNPSATYQQHQQVSQTIFWCVNHHTTCNDDMNREIIDISDDDEEEDENTRKNGTSIDDSSDEKEIEVIQLSDEEEIEVIQLSDDDEEDEVVNNESSCENADNFESTFKTNESTLNLAIDLTHKIIQSTNSNLSITSNNRSKWLCPAVDCQFETSAQKHLTIHVKQSHEKGLFPCSRCSMQFEYRNKRRSHYVAKHQYPHNRATKRFRCTCVGCSFVGRDKSNLEAHQIVHTTLRPFRCTWPDCGYSGKERSTSIAHVRNRHLQIPKTKKKASQRNIQCNQDARQFPIRIK